MEDDSLNCLVMKTSLEVGFRLAFGIKVDIMTLQTAEDALQLIEDMPVFDFDVVVADQHMEMAGGVMKGSRLIEVLNTRIRTEFADIYASRRPALVIASANTDEHEKRAYSAGGADIVWPKPYPPNAQMVQDLQRFWNRPEAECLEMESAVNAANPKPVRSGSSRVVPG